MTQRKLTALTAAAVCIVTSMYSFHISTDRIGAVKSALNENDTRAQEPAKTTTLSSTVIGPGLQKFTTYTSMDNSFPEFVKREENVYTLLPAAWSNQSSLSTYPEGACNKASYWKFDRHGCSHLKRVLNFDNYPIISPLIYCSKSGEISMFGFGAIQSLNK